MKLLQLTPEPLRPQLEEVDPELWQPDWKCFCCHDTGIIAGHLLQQIMPDFDDLKHKPVACQNSGCEAGELRDEDYYDQRVPSPACRELDKQERQSWRDELFAQSKGIRERNLELVAVTTAVTMPGTRGRNTNDEREIEIRKANAENMPLEAVSDGYQEA